MPGGVIIIIDKRYCYENNQSSVSVVRCVVRQEVAGEVITEVANEALNSSDEAMRILREAIQQAQLYDVTRLIAQCVDYLTHSGSISN